MHSSFPHLLACALVCSYVTVWCTTGIPNACQPAKNSRTATT
jgi:hypothetical protein